MQPVSRLRTFSALIRRGNLSTTSKIPSANISSTAPTTGYSATNFGSDPYKTPGPPITRKPLTDRFTTGPYEIPGEPRPFYPKRKSPFKRAAAIMQGLNMEEGLRMMNNKRAIFPLKIPQPRAGMIIRVTYVQSLEEGTVSKYFTGICMAVRRRGMGSTVVLRNVVDGVAVERGFAFFSPLIKNAEVMGQKRVRRAKLYYLRNKALKESTVPNPTARPKKE